MYCINYRKTSLRCTTHLPWNLPRRARRRLAGMPKGRLGDGRPGQLRDSVHEVPGAGDQAGGVILGRGKKVIADNSSNSTQVRRHAFAAISGIISLVADGATLVNFIRGLDKFTADGSLGHSGIWVVIQLILTVYGNFALAFVYVIRIIRIQARSASSAKPDDMWKALKFLIAITWMPTFLIWVTSCAILTANVLATSIRDPDSLVLGWVISIMFIFCPGVFVAIVTPGPIGRAIALLVRTMRPDLPIQIFPRGKSWWT